MCDLALSFARHILLPMADLANQIKGLPVEIQKMKDELEKIQTSIYEADRMSAAEEDKLRVSQLVERAFCLEDIIDEYTICEQWQLAHDPPFAALPSEAASFIKTMFLRVQIAYKIKLFEWKQKRSERDHGGLLVPLSSSSSSSEQGPCRSSSGDYFQDNVVLLNEADVVGFEAPKQKMIEWLTSGKQELTVISVVGMGGQGKTTLARLVFKNQQVIKHFSSRIWVSVSQSYTVEGLLRSMLKEFYEEQKKSRSQLVQVPSPQDISSMDRLSLKEEVLKYLQEKSYVIFFDDAWQTTFWDDVEQALCDNICGSRVFITARDEDVIQPCRRSSIVKVHHLQPLTRDEPKKLFYKKAFLDSGGSCPQNLEDISSKILNKCNGLPLAIVVIGGALAGKTELDDWNSFYLNLSSELERVQGLNIIKKILGVSYDYLPPHLIPCLLYFGMYPEDYEVRSERMIRQWIAEGFVKEEAGKSLEKVAERYLKELISKNLVQTLHIDYGRVKSCRVHDLVRDLILEKFEDLSFGHFVTGDQTSSLSVKRRRRLSIATGFNDFMISTERSSIQSLLLFTEEHFPLVFLRAILAKYKLLKVLDFERFGFNCGIPENLGTLVLLRYLSFRGTCIKILPKSIGELKNLETLDVRDTEVEELPKEIGNLTKLRHLLFSSKVNFTPFLDSVGGMTSLQTLGPVYLEANDAARVEVLGNLAQLRDLELTISLLDCNSERALCSLLNRLQHLEELYIDAYNGTESIDLNPGATPKLRVLHAEGKLPCNFPTWILGLHNLVELILKGSKLDVDDLQSLQKLSSLLFLDISYSYHGDTWHIEDHGFQKLKRLRLDTFGSLKSFNIDRGALPSLEKLILYDIPKLKKVPEGFKHLNNLKHLVVISSFKIEDDQDREIVKHVPCVEIQ